MGIARGANIVRDGLVVGYDTGYGVADPGLSTRFFKGKPTTNLQVNGVAAGHNSGGYGNVVTVADAPEKGPRWKKVTISNRGNNFRILQWTYTTHDSGVIYSHSAEFDWGNMRDKGYYMPFDGSGGGTRVHYINRNYTTNGGSSINANRQDGHFASTMVKSGGSHVHAWFIYNNTTGVSGLNDYFYYRDYQVERETEASPFISGTRSDTASLIDLKRTRDIDLSYMSFDSTGQPDMDGSSDYIDLGSDVAISPINQGWTAEYVFNTDSASTLQHFNGAEEDTHNANWLALLSSYMAVWDHGANVWKYGSTQFSDNTWYHIAFVQQTGTSMQFYVNGVAEGGNHASFSWTASRSALNCRYVGRYEHNGGYSRYFNGHIPVTRLYSKALTAPEITQNFNAYKNRFNI